MATVYDRPRRRTSDHLPPRSAALGTLANSSSRAGQGVAHLDRKKYKAQRKSGRYGVRSQLWGVTTLKRVRNCGRVPVDPNGSVALRVGPGNSGFAGLVTCGSVWACPVCSWKIAGRRAEELTQVFDGVLAAGNTLGMLTLTARHHRGQKLDGLWKAMNRAWSRVTSGGGWVRLRDQYGLEWVRVTEVRHGRNGWHPHQHIGMSLAGHVTDDQAKDLEGRLWALWSRALRREGLTADREHGIDVRVRHTSAGALELAQYMVKSLAAELTAGDEKTGREPGSRAPFEVLADLVATGDADDLDLWREWERVSHGKRQMTWSRGFRQKYVAEEELTDEELAAADEGGDDVLLMDRPTWATVAPVQGELLVAADRFGAVGARAWLRRRGLSWVEVCPQAA